MSLGVEFLTQRREKLGARKISRSYRDEVTYVKRERSCLRCGSYFMSSWIGNRICPTCTRSDVEVSPYDPILNTYGTLEGKPAY